MLLEITQQNQTDPEDNVYIEIDQIDDLIDNFAQNEALNEYLKQSFSQFLLNYSMMKKQVILSTNSNSQTSQFPLVTVLMTRLKTENLSTILEYLQQFIRSNSGQSDKIKLTKLQQLFQSNFSINLKELQTFEVLRYCVQNQEVDYQQFIRRIYELYVSDSENKYKISYFQVLNTALNFFQNYEQHQLQLLQKQAYQSFKSNNFFIYPRFQEMINNWDNQFQVHPHFYCSVLEQNNFLKIYDNLIKKSQGSHLLGKETQNIDFNQFYEPDKITELLVTLVQNCKMLSGNWNNFGNIEKSLDSPSRSKYIEKKQSVISQQKQNQQKNISFINKGNNTFQTKKESTFKVANKLSLDDDQSRVSSFISSRTQKNSSGSPIKKDLMIKSMSPKKISRVSPKKLSKS